jgi:hypothetical protein
VWIWPDKDGVEKWEAKVKHLLNDRIQIYTRFFDRYWIEEDGKKADVCDINLRLLCHPETDQKSRQKPKDNDVIVWDSSEPFMDPEEACNPWLRWARSKMSRVKSIRWGKWSNEPSTVDTGMITKIEPLL